MNFVVFRTVDFDKKRERDRERDKGGVGGTAPTFLLNLLGFRHCLQICHFVLIIRRQVIARVRFRHCVQILNYLGFRRTVTRLRRRGMRVPKLMNHFELGLRLRLGYCFLFPRISFMSHGQ
ncbi:hypothetical protein HanPI659440_Chr09g0318771 [Helianthus annuus]|nr:hypothetical protein HanPI659440_Chr09g0318771 [Helianthus annuus]